MPTEAKNNGPPSERILLLKGASGVRYAWNGEKKSIKSVSHLAFSNIDFKRRSVSRINLQIANFIQQAMRAKYLVKILIERLRSKTLKLERGPCPRLLQSLFSGIIIIVLTRLH